MGTIEINGTTYTVERATSDVTTYFLTGPQGGTIIAVPFSNDPDTYHAFRVNSTHSSLRVHGNLVKIPRTDLEAATE